MNDAPLSWIAIARIGLVQTALGAIVVLMTSTINRVMVVELALPAVVPGLLVASHYGVQILRPAWGHGSDVGGRRTSWIIGGMATLAIGGFGAALGAALASISLGWGLALAALSFLLVGAGAGAAGTSALAMLAARVAPARRAPAATTVWVMMILGFAVTAPLAGHFLDPFSNARLVGVTAAVCAVAFTVACLAVWGLEGERKAERAFGAQRTPFVVALRQVWAEPAARRFTIFIFVSMLAYGAQELLVEPFAGLVFGLTPGATTQLAGLQHGGALLGMIGVALASGMIGGPVFGSHRLWIVTGCLGSALALVGIAASGFVSSGAEALRIAVFGLGVANGVFAVAAIGSMMALAGGGGADRSGTRMGVWGAAQAIAFGLGELVATVLVGIAGRFAAGPAHGLRDRLCVRGDAVCGGRSPGDPAKPAEPLASMEIECRR